MQWSCYKLSTPLWLLSSNMNFDCNPDYWAHLWLNSALGDELIREVKTIVLGKKVEKGFSEVYKMCRWYAWWVTLQRRSWNCFHLCKISCVLEKSTLLPFFFYKKARADQIIGHIYTLSIDKSDIYCKCHSLWNAQANVVILNNTNSLYSPKTNTDHNVNLNKSDMWNTH